MIYEQLEKKLRGLGVANGTKVQNYKFIETLVTSVENDKVVKRKRVSIEYTVDIELTEEEK